MTTPRVHVSRLFEPLNCVSASIPCLHHLPSEAATSVNWSNTGLLLRWPVASFPGARLSPPAAGPLVPLSQPPPAPLRGAAPFPSWPGPPGLLTALLAGTPCSARVPSVGELPFPSAPLPAPLHSAPLRSPRLVRCCSFFLSLVTEVCKFRRGGAWLAAAASLRGHPTW